MKRFGAAAAIVGFLPLFWASHSQAADVKVYGSTSFKAVLDELGPQFEKATENKLVFAIGPAATLKTQIDQGADFDVAILTLQLMDTLASAGKLDPASRVTIARAGLGVVVGASAAKPDISTDESLKQALLNAKSIGYNGVGSSRASVEAAFGKLGVADAIKSKIHLLDVSAPVAVGKGEVEMGLGPVSEALLVSGVQVAGFFPADVQTYLLLAGGVSSSSRSASAARALLEFLRSPAAGPVLKSKGMEPS
jgi:molybdate transport system substrate-binding protein